MTRSAPDEFGTETLVIR